MIGPNWTCAVPFFPALPERIRWLHGLDCHAISFASCNNLQIEHASQAPRWRKQVDCRDWATPRRTNPSTADPTPQKCPSAVSKKHFSGCCGQGALKLSTGRTLLILFMSDGLLTLNTSGVCFEISCDLSQDDFRLSV